MISGVDGKFDDCNDVDRIGFEAATSGRRREPLSQ